MKKFKILILAVLMILIGILSAFIAFHLLQKKSFDESAQTIREVDETPQEEFSDNIRIPGMEVLTLAANSKKQAVNFYNPSANSGINFVITLALEDGTAIYKSGLIAPGKAVYEIELLKELESGQYNATLKYECETDKGTRLNGATVNIILEVKEEI